MNKPLVSIITPCYNAEKTIRDTIESVLKQDYENFEYIIVDGQSTDRTLDIINEYSDSRIRYISEKDNGVYDAMNKGIKMAKGVLVGIINADDWYEQDALTEVVSKYNEGQMEIHYGMLAIYKNNVLEKKQLIYDSMLYMSMISHPTCFVAKKVYDELGGYDTNYAMTADYEFMVRCKYSKKVQFIVHEKTLANFRIGGLSSNDRTKDIAYMENLQVRKKYALIDEKVYKREMKIVNFKNCIKKIAKIIKK